MLSTIKSLEELPVIAEAVLSKSKSKTCILFYGEMGVGKTTLIKELCKQLGVKDNISSPTFSIVNEYKTSNGPVFHFDFYRIEDEEEVLDFGVEEYFESGNLCLMEWPEKISNFLPDEEDSLVVEIKQEGNLRTYKIGIE